MEMLEHVIFWLTIRLNALPFPPSIYTIKFTGAPTTCRC